MDICSTIPVLVCGAAGFLGWFKRAREAEVRGVELEEVGFSSTGAFLGGWCLSIPLLLLVGAGGGLLISFTCTFEPPCLGNPEKNYDAAGVYHIKQVECWAQYLSGVAGPSVLD